MSDLPDDASTAPRQPGVIDAETVRAIEAIVLVAVEPVPPGGGGGKGGADIDRLSAIIKTFNDLFGNIAWTDRDRIARVIAVDLPERVNADVRYQNAKKNSDRENARVEHDRALSDAITERLEDESELFTRFTQDQRFKDWLREVIFEATYDSASA